MRKPVAAVVTSAWFVIAPGVGGVLAPYLLTGRRYGAAYDDYQRAVPAWWPRLTRRA